MKTKVVVLWTSIVYAVCYAGVALFPGIRSRFAMYALHTDVVLGTDVLSATTFFTGLVIWNVVVLLGVWLYKALDRKFG